MDRLHEKTSSSDASQKYLGGKIYLHVGSVDTQCHHVAASTQHRVLTLTPPPREIQCIFSSPRMCCAVPTPPAYTAAPSRTTSCQVDQAKEQTYGDFYRSGRDLTTVRTCHSFSYLGPILSIPATALVCEKNFDTEYQEESSRILA